MHAAKSDLSSGGWAPYSKPLLQVIRIPKAQHDTIVQQYAFQYRKPTCTYNNTAWLVQAWYSSTCCAIVGLQENVRVQISSGWLGAEYVPLLVDYWKASDRKAHTSTYRLGAPWVEGHTEYCMYPG